MSRCGSCDLYWNEGKENYGVTCEGNLCAEECADNLQSLVFNLRNQLEQQGDEKK